MSFLSKAVDDLVAWIGTTQKITGRKHVGMGIKFGGAAEKGGKVAHAVCRAKMFSTANKEDNVVKNMAKEIVRDCGLSGAVVSLEAATHLLQLKLLLPSHSFTHDKILDRSFMQSIVAECVRDFLDESVWISTIKLQAYAEKNAPDRARIEKEHEEDVWERSRTILKEIAEMNPMEKDGKDKLYRKMVLFTIIFSGLGSPTSSSVLREAQAALQSIFKYGELQRFVALPETEKKEQMVEFTKIVSGIRLFNKDSQKGGDGIDDLPFILAEASQVSKERADITLRQLTERRLKLIAVCTKAYSLWSRNLGEDEPHFELPPGFAASDLERLKRILFMTREHEYYIKKVLGVIQEASTSIEDLCDRFRRTLLQLHELVRYRSAILTDQVFPLFIMLSYIWEGMQKEAILLSEVNSYLANLNSLNKYSEITELELAMGSGESSEKHNLIPVSNVRKMDRSQLQEGVTVVESLSVDFLQELQLEGHCPWALAVTQGLLVPGNLDVGFLRYGDRLYSFSTPMAAYSWGKNPEHFIRSILLMSRSYLELVKILNLYDYLYELRADSLSEAEPDAVARNNVEVQTETHPIKSHLDKDYSFSTWELKRKALQLSRLINCRTKSQQTVNHSHFRESIGLQIQPDKNKWTQTKRDGSCNHPTPSTYLLGLRGHYEDKFLVLDLTSEKEETNNTNENCQ